MSIANWYFKNKCFYVASKMADIHTNSPSPFPLLRDEFQKILFFLVKVLKTARAIKQTAF